jgi:TRAP-type C4-dicarboxylate transport system permease small subunit
MNEPAQRNDVGGGEMAIAHKLAYQASIIFGYMFLAFSIMVALETVLRKLANFSFQGVDELGGYALAVGATLAFSVAVIERAHVRIDLVHNWLPETLKAVMNWLAALSLALFGWLMVFLGWEVVADSISYKSTAQTPWATPLVYPQGAWLAAIAIFAFVPTWLTVRSVIWLLHGRADKVNEALDPRGTAEELEEELADMERR